MSQFLKSNLFKVREFFFVRSQNVDIKNLTGEGFWLLNML